MDNISRDFLISLIYSAKQVDCSIEEFKKRVLENEKILNNSNKTKAEAFKRPF